MLFPFRASAIFRNRWVALLWAAGICFTAAEIADTVSGVTTRTGDKPQPVASSALPPQEDSQRSIPPSSLPALTPDRIVK